MTLLKRWSVWALTAVALAGIFGPLLFSGTPADTVATPFAKPMWLDRAAPPAVHLVLEDGHTSKELKWTWAAPGEMVMEGSYHFAEAPGEAHLIWETPSGQAFTLADISGKTEGTLSLDARDISFKQALGLSPFKNPLPTLFPEPGTYTLRLESTEKPAGLSLKMDLPGKRWGLLGTDQRGRDVFRLFLLGIRVSLLVGIAATLIATATGLVVGLVSGYAGGWLDSLLMRIVDILLSIPVLPILMVLAGIWGKGLWQIILILGLFSWMGTARTVRSMALTLREACFVENLRALGAPTWYILFRHLVPETLPLLLATVALGVPGAILAEAGLSFLGLSDPRIISWGRMLHEAHGFGAFTAGAWWLILPPGIGIAIICLIFLSLGRALEEMADPTLRGGDNA